MNIFAINGSPKIGVSNSGTVLSILHEMLGSGVSWNEWCPMEAQRKKRTFDPSLLKNADTVIFAASLYVDGLHSTLMRFMEEQEHSFSKSAGSKRIFTVINCGFYEGKQTEYALEMIRHFSHRIRQQWSGGVGIGTGEMIAMTQQYPPKSFIRRPVTAALEKLVEVIQTPDGRLNEPIFTQHAIPRFLFKLAGEAGWRKIVKKNGLKSKDLYARPL